MAAELDSFLALLGNPGRYQVFVCCLLLCNIFPAVFNVLNMIFIGSTPPHHCKVAASLLLNDSTTQEKNASEVTECTTYADSTSKNHSQVTMRCPNGWDYQYPGKEWGIVGEWNLVCDRKHLVGMATTLYFGGTLVTTPLIGSLSDKIGRKWLVVGGLLGHVIIGVSQFFANSFAMFVCLRVLHGAVLEAVGLAGSNLRIELLQTEHRTSVSIASGYVWCVAQFVLVAIAYFFPVWRYFYLATTLPSLVVISYIWLLPESLRWLLVKNKVKEASALAQKIVRINRIQLKTIHLEDEVVALAQSLKAKETMSLGLRDLFRTGGVRKTTLIACYIWFCMPLIYYGINFALPSLDGNKYVNFLIGAALEVVSTVVYHVVMKNFGRRMPSCVFFILSGVLCVGSVVAKFAFDDGVHWSILAVGCALVGKAVSSLGWGCSYLLLTELFPTVLRGAALGLGAVVCTLGAMAAPQILVLGEYCSTLLPLVTFGLTSFLAGGLVLLLPETRYVSIPDTIEEAELLHSMCTNEIVTNLNTTSAATGPSTRTLQDEEGITKNETFCQQTTYSVF